MKESQMKILKNFRPIDLVAWSATALFIAVASHRPAGAATADDRAVLLSECGSCHIAYPANFLPPAAWSQVLGRLDQHYGVDASLDDASAAAVSRQLRVPRVSGAQLPRTNVLPRITTSPWFRDEHDEVRADTWRRTAVKSAANCDACHRDAARGDFAEDNVRIPR
jgi:nitrate/TMAO reductase-like tetraheme cytochrome c subunit